MDNAGTEMKVSVFLCFQHEHTLIGKGLWALDECVKIYIGLIIIRKQTSTRLFIRTKFYEFLD